VEQRARHEVARVVKAERGRLRNASAPVVLAVLSGAALAPVVAAVATGSGVAGALVTLAGVAGNVGSGHLTGLVEKLAARIRDKSTDLREPEAVRGTVEAELLTALAKSDSGAQELRIQLTDLLLSVDGMHDAIGAAGAELREHLVACLWQLAGQQKETLAKLDALGTEQWRQGRQLRHQTTLLAEMVDRQRWMMREQAGPPDRASTGPPPPVRPVIVASDGQRAGSASGWHGGADVVIGDRVYLIYDTLAEERSTGDHSVVLRQAQGLLHVPAPGPGDGYVWLRQALPNRGRNQNSATARRALSALAAERDLLAGLSKVRGMPRVSQFALDGPDVSLVLGWPASRSTGAACETLAAFVDRDARPMDSWQLFRTLTGLAGLCATLATLHDHGVAHRCLAPAGIIALDDGHLVLRDLGLAGRGTEPGEGPAEYQAPEQRRQAQRQPGPETDVYQLAAVAYHLATGRPPLARTPLPVRAQAPGLPERAAVVLDAALVPEPSERPDVGVLGDALRAAGGELR
jgi:Protein kinase domain